MQTIPSSQALILPIQKHEVTNEIFIGLNKAAQNLGKPSLGEPSRGRKAFQDVLTELETKSGKEERILHLQKAYSKYDTLHLELQKPIFLAGVFLSAEQRANIHNNAQEIKKLLLAGINSLQSNKPISSSVAQSNLPTTVVPILPPQTNSHVSDANGVHYKRLPEGGAGYCGDMAVAQVTNTECNPSLSRPRLDEIRDAQTVFSSILEDKDRLTDTVSIYPPTVRFDALKVLIPRFSQCQAHALHFINAGLQAEDFKDKDGPKASLEAKAKVFDVSQSYDDLWNNYCHITENPETDQLAFNRFFESSLPVGGFQIREDLNFPSNFLIEGELQALMLDQGYMFSGNILPPDGTRAVQGAYTVLEFRHLINGSVKHIASDSPPLSQNRMGLQPEGFHYIPVELTTR